jgi:serine protease
MKKIMIWAVLLFLPATLMAATERFANLPNGSMIYADRFIVTTRTGVPSLAIDQVMSGNSVTGVNSIDNLCAEQNITSIEHFYDAPVKTAGLKDLIPRMYIFHVGEGVDVQNACQAFRGSPDVECADLYDIPKLFYTPNDPSRNSQFHLGRVDVFRAWDIFRGDTTRYAIVGIVDTGVYWSHPDLVANMWVNPGEDLDGDGRWTSADNNGADDDGNGYIDDVIGWDFGRGDNNPQEDAAIHGTHVAGCASEVTDNNLNGAGVGFHVRLMAAKGARRDTLNAVYQAMTYAVENGAMIINCSWGSASFSQTYQNLINGFWNSGAVIVAAAGNDGVSTRFYPAAYTHVVSVAATTSTDHRASFSNYGTWIDISAPGQGIYSTWSTNSMTTLDGTSMASPITSGVAGLIRAAHPSWSNDDVVNTLISSADNIDNLNPGYAGQLGSGRVNAYNALYSSIYPNIEVLDNAINVVNDDGDSLLNPGESFTMITTLENHGADANNVIVAISSPDFQIADSTAAFGNMIRGQAVFNDTDPFLLTAGESMVPGNHPITLRITADSAYAETVTVLVNVTMYQRGFPRTLGGTVQSSPVIVDFDNDGSNEIIVGAMDRNVYSIEADGSYTSGWPNSVTGDIIAAVAVGDLDHNGVNEAVVASKDGKIYAWHANGAPVANFPVTRGGMLYSGPLLADIDGDLTLEIIFGSFSDNKVYVLNADGSDHQGWPSAAFNKWYGSPSSGDIDGDHIDEIVYAGFDSSLYVWNGDGSLVSGFPVHLDGQVYTAPSIGDLDLDSHPEIVVVTYTGSCYVVRYDGTIAANFPVHYAGTNIRSTPALADLTGDGLPEIIFGTLDGNLHALTLSGTEAAGFPKPLTGGIFSSPVVGDITGDALQDVVVGTLGGNLYGFDHLGNVLRNFPIMGSTQRQINSSPALGDLDRDGDMEIVVPINVADSNLVVYGYRGQASIENLKWPNYGRDCYRSNNYNGVATGIEESSAVPSSFSLTQNYPNPFNATTLIQFSMKKDGEATLSIYDLLGRQIKVINSGHIAAGNHTFTWNGTDKSGVIVNSGVYFYRLESGEGILTKSMILLK